MVPGARVRFSVISGVLAVFTGTAVDAIPDVSEALTHVTADLSAATSRVRTGSRGMDLGGPALLVRVSSRSSTRASQAPPRPGLEHVGLETATRCVDLFHSSATRVGSDPTGRLTVALWGETNPSRTPDALAAELLEHGAESARAIDGSYVLLAVDHARDDVQVITDRFGTRRVFHAERGDGCLVSSSLSALPTDDYPLDPTGVAWYLSNGVIHCGHTAFDGIQVLRHASVHRLSGAGVDTVRHWLFPATGGEGPEDVRPWEDEYLRLCVRATEAAVAGTADVYLSLSGGWDSAGLLGILARDLGRQDVRCFSYAQGPVEPGTDAWAAREMARRVGYEHEVLQAYDGDLVSHILENARLGEGVAHVCDEVDAWRALEGRVDAVADPVLLAGEHRHGNSVIRIEKRGKRARAPGKVRPFTVLAWMAPLFPSETYERFADLVGRERDKTFEIAAALDQDFGYHYVNHRMPTTLLPWRAHFPGRFMTPRYPYLANPAVDFIASIPRSVWRSQLFHAVERVYPDVFDVPRATTAGYYISLSEEVRTHADRLRELVAETDSRLDDMVPPSVALGLIRMIEEELSTGSRVKRKGRHVRLKVTEAGKKLVGAELAAPGSRLSSGRALRNLLVLRQSLAKRESA